MLTFNIAVLIILSWTATIAAQVQIEAMSRGFYNFSVDLYQQCSQFKSGNLVISPFSVGTSLTLLSEAANGTTYEQLRKHLHLNGDKSDVADKFKEYIKIIKRSAGQSELMIANQIYVHEGFQLNQDFRKIASDMLGESTTVFMVNTIYLKSIWLQPFPRHKKPGGGFYDWKENFYISETETVEANFMKMKKKVWIVDLHELDIAALRLDYFQSNFSFIIILPNKRMGLSTLEAQLQNINLSKIVEKMKFMEYEVQIPKFKVTTELLLNDILKKIGMNDMFELEANFSGLLSTTVPLYVSHVIHQATIEINEKLSEASAATGSIHRRLSGTGIFRADHPFMFYVWDRETNTTIFNGCIKNFPTDITLKQ
ncbi:leukocyte elastase inhibitor-like [Contarinia nasturtii]|uniref:leukocyte elastase inhibitor-like n=1 Tax=Contarinia nasturtii TaxID=265458 RepID=UPI0012D376B4|nr:leukocyte elastase inhibitor-like [Contarinia nasturtii]